MLQGLLLLLFLYWPLQVSSNPEGPISALHLRIPPLAVSVHFHWILFLRAVAVSVVRFHSRRHSVGYMHTEPWLHKQMKLLMQPATCGNRACCH